MSESSGGSVDAPGPWSPRPRFAIFDPTQPVRTTRRALAHFLRTHVRATVVAAALLGGAATAAGYYHPPLALLQPGPTLDVSSDVEIEGVPVHATSGRYLMTTVRFERPNVLRLVLAAALSFREVLPLEHDQARISEQQRQFRESRRLAAAAAARWAGLSAGDDRPSFAVRFKERRVLGSSGGLAYALAIADMLSGRDLSRGRTITASGRVDPGGSVAAVLGMEQKAKAVARMRPDVFIVPSPNIYDALRFVSRAQPVDRFEEAVELLER